MQISVLFMRQAKVLAKVTFLDNLRAQDLSIPHDMTDLAASGGIKRGQRSLH